MIFEHPPFLDILDTHTYGEEKKIMKESEKGDRKRKNREIVLEISIVWDIQKKFLLEVSNVLLTSRIDII